MAAAAMAAPASAAAAAGLAGMSTDNAKGLVLAVSSSAFIGASFIVKKMGLRRAADSGVRAGEFAAARARVLSGCLDLPPRAGVRFVGGGGWGG